MPASLLEAFSSPSIGGTESLHNPRYELELDRNPFRGFSGGTMNSQTPTDTGNPGLLSQKSRSGLVPSTGRIYDSQGSSGVLNHGYPNAVQMGGMCQSPTIYASNIDSRSSVSLDNETKCDLHLYHILSCKTCREKLKALLNCNDNAKQLVPTQIPQPLPQPLPQQLPQSIQVNQLLQGLLGLNIDEKIRAAVSKSRPDEKVIIQQPAETKKTDNLLLYILIGIFVLYLLDLIIRRRWFT